MADGDEVLSLPGIGRATLVRRGDFSSLYRGVQERFERVVAVKVLVGRTVDPDATARFERECTALGRLSGHPGIAAVFDAGVLRRRPYIVREWLPAGSLEDRLRTGGALPWRQALDIGVKLAGALESLHRAGIVHRNLKPHNVFVSPFGDPLLADFELAAADRAFVTRGADTYDTEVHAAPELYRGATPSPATDVYALASVVATLVLGHPPFSATDDDSLVQVTARKDAGAPPDLTARGAPPPVASVMARALSPDPGVRPATARALGRLLQAAQRATGQPPTRLVVLPESDEERAEPLPSIEGRAAPRDVPAGPLAHQVRTLVEQAVAAYEGRPAHARLAAALAGLDQPLRVALVGPAGSGTSTLLDALVGEELALADGDTPRPAVWYTHGPDYRAEAHSRSGAVAELALARRHGRLEIADAAGPDAAGPDAAGPDAAGPDAAGIDRVVVAWPSSSLAAMTLIDAPPLGTGAPVGEVLDQADAVVYVLARLRPDDVARLEAVQAEGRGGPNPFAAVGVLARADEVGMEGSDAMEVAGRVAAGWRKDAALRRLCHDVVPVDALLARGAAGLRPEEHRLFALLAALPAAAVDASLASAGAFADPARSGRPSADERARLLERFGLYGVRAAVAAMRARPARTVAELAAELTARSGIETLRSVLSTHFVARGDVLKAGAALATVSAVLREDPGPDEQVEWALERVQAGAHELAEVRLVNALRSHQVTFPPGEADEVDRLLGGAGAAPAARLGLAPDAGVDELAAVLGQTIARWRARAESPMSSRAEAEAAGVLVRTCEGMLAPLLSG